VLAPLHNINKNNNQPHTSQAKNTPTQIKRKVVHTDLNWVLGDMFATLTLQPQDNLLGGLSLLNEKKKSSISKQK